MKSGGQQNEDAQHNWLTFAQSEDSIFATFCDRFPSYLEEYLNWPSECAWAIGETQAQLDKDFRRAEAQFGPAIESATRDFCRDPKSTHDVSPAVSYFLSVRGRVLGGLFQQLTVETSPGTFESIHTIIPFPSKPLNEVLEWFLIDWWREHGPRGICETRVIDDAVRKL